MRISKASLAHLGGYPDLVIVVVGSPYYIATAAGANAGGLAVQIALAAAAQDRSVQCVGTVGADDAGDAVVLALARGGVGHAAMLRQAGRPTPHIQPTGDERIDAEGGPPDASVSTGTAPDAFSVSFDGPRLDAADVDLALRYLTDFAVLVLADRAEPEMAEVVAGAASWAGARLIVVVPVGEPEPAGLPGEAIVFEAPDADPDGVFAAMVGSFAAALDDGDDPAAAFRSTVAAGGWMTASDGELA